MIELIKELQKHILAKPLGTTLYVSDEAFQFFGNSFKPAPPPREEVPYVKVEYKAPPPPKKIAPPPPPQPVVILEEKSKSKDVPDYDYKLMKEMVGSLRPNLKILDVPATCLIIGTPDDLAVMENIKKAIQDTLKKTAVVYTEAPKEIHGLVIISEEALEKHPVKSQLTVKTFRSLSPPEKRELWNQIKAHL